MFLFGWARFVRGGGAFRIRPIWAPVSWTSLKTSFALFALFALRMTRPRLLSRGSLMRVLDQIAGAIELAHGVPEGFELPFVRVLLYFGLFERLHGFFHFEQHPFEVLIDLLNLLDGLANRRPGKNGTPRGLAGNRWLRLWLAADLADGFLGRSSRHRCAAVGDFRCGQFGHRLRGCLGDRLGWRL